MKKYHKLPAGFLSADHMACKFAVITQTMLIFVAIFPQSSQNSCLLGRMCPCVWHAQKLPNSFFWNLVLEIYMRSSYENLILVHITVAILQVRHLDTGFWLKRCKFSPKWLPVRFMVKKAALKHTFSQCSSAFPY
jgi:hypothetical protein